MRIVFSAPIELNRTGPGTPLGKIAEALFQSEHQVILNTLGPFTMEGGIIRIVRYRNPYQFDEFLSWEAIQDLDKADILLAPGGSSLFQMEMPKVAVTTWFSSHYAYAYKVLKEEYAKWQVHREPIDLFTMWRAKMEQNLSDLLLVPAGHCAETYVENGVEDSRLGKVEFGVDTTTFRPPKDDVGIEHPFRVLFAGGNYMRKGLRFLLEAWDTLPIQNKELVILGCHPFDTQRRDIKVKGWVPDEQLPSYYRTADVFCLPSLEEGMALATLEAMASACPVVVTRESGAPVTDNKDGLIIPAGDSRAIADTILYLHDEPDDAAEIGKAARKTAMKFTWERFQEQVMGHLEGLVES